MTVETSRLYITPFSRDLAQTIESTYTSLTHEAISHHQIETFPEKSYGFVELSSMEADKLKKKLNGAILKGKKLRVEDARPQKRGHDVEEVVDDSISCTRNRKKRTERPEATNSTLQGHQLSPARKIKRGWTEAGKGQQECLFRVQMPANKQELASASATAGKDQSKKKKRKNEDATSTKTIVHEFDKSHIEPAFIRQESGIGEDGLSAGFVEEMGWVNQHGSLVEPVSKRWLRHHKRADLPKSGGRATKSFIQSKGEATSGSQEFHVDNLPKNESSPLAQSKAPESIPKAVTDIADEETSSSGTSSSSEESSPESKTEDASIPEPDFRKADSDVDPAGADSTGASVHPLETLFKRPRQAASRANDQKPLEIKTSFNFFEPDGERNMPQTPFTTKDLQLRSLRSAAPTPDTAHPTRKFFAEPASPSSKVGKEGQNEVENPSKSIEASTDGNEESEFTKWFWEHRGDNNRAWKGRRRETLKENRQKETRERETRLNNRRGR